MKINLLVMVLFTLVLSTTGCIRKDPTTTSALPIQAVTSELTIVPSSDHVDDFLSKDNIYISDYETDSYYNITPDFIANNSEFSIFQYFSGNSVSYLLFEDEAYLLGGLLAGPLTSMALGDLDQDNQYELYFTFTWGSGILHTQIGYFDPSTKKVTVFENQFLNQNIMLTATEAGTLSVNEATLNGDSTIVDFTIKSSNILVANLVLENGHIKLNAIERD